MKDLFKFNPDASNVDVFKQIDQIKKMSNSIFCNLIEYRSKVNDKDDAFSYEDFFIKVCRLFNGMADITSISEAAARNQYRIMEMDLWSLEDDVWSDAYQSADEVLNADLENPQELAIRCERIGSYLCSEHFGYRTLKVEIEKIDKGVVLNEQMMLAEDFYRIVKNAVEVKAEEKGISINIPDFNPDIIFGCQQTDEDAVL